MAQTLKVTGTVTDATDGAPVIGAAVKVLGTTTGSVTDFDGKYTINVASGATLEFSYIGMKTQTVRVGTQTVINVVLEQDAMLLEDVMVVAYQTVKKSSYTGSAATVKKDQIEKIQSTNITKSLPVYRYWELLVSRVLLLLSVSAVSVQSTHQALRFM